MVLFVALTAFFDGSYVHDHAVSELEAYSVFPSRKIPWFSFQLRLSAEPHGRDLTVLTAASSTTFVLDFTLRHVPPLSWRSRATMPLPCCTTRRFPLPSNWMDRGLVRPVAISAIRYPEAMLGFTEFVGVNVVEHEDAEEETAATRVTRHPVAAARAAKGRGHNMIPLLCWRRCNGR